MAVTSNAVPHWYKSSECTEKEIVMCVFGRNSLPLIGHPKILWNEKRVSNTTCAPTKGMNSAMFQHIGRTIQSWENYARCRNQKC